MTRRRAPFPRLPRTLIPREVAFQRRLGRPWFRGPRPVDAPPLRAEDLTPADRRQLRQRAWARAQRIRRRDFRNALDHFWLQKELALGLSDAPPQTIRAWRIRLFWVLRQTEDRLAALRQLEARILMREPEKDAWLRRQLATLETGGPA
jgi:hypothetical protein